MAFQFGQQGSTWTQSGTCTITIATSGVITFTNTFAAGDSVKFTTTGALPTGITAGTVYFVSASALSGSSFKIAGSYSSAIAGTGSVATSGTQSGVHTVTLAQTAGTMFAAGYGLQSKGYLCSLSATITDVQYFVGSGSFASSVQLAIYQGTGNTAVLQGYSTPQAVTANALNTFNMISPMSVNAGTTYSFVAIPDSGHFLYYQQQVGGYAFNSTQYTNANIVLAGVPLSSPGATSGSSTAEFIVWANGTTGPTYIPQVRRRRIYIPAFFPR